MTWPSPESPCVLTGNTCVPPAYRFKDILDVLGVAPWLLLNAWQCCSWRLVLLLPVLLAQLSICLLKRVQLSHCLWK